MSLASTQNHTALFEFVPKTKKKVRGSLYPRMGENNYVIVHLKLKIIASPEHFATFNGICKHSYICTRKHTHTPTKCQLTFELIANESESATEIIVDFNDFMKAFRRSFAEYSASRKNNQKNIG